MTTFQNILFPVDFSERCLQSMSYMAGIARKFNSELTLLHALDIYNPFGYGAISSTVAYGEAADVLKRQREFALADFGSEVLEGLAVRRVMEMGEPADCITRYAGQHAVDLIAMPTHGGGRFRRLLLGSITAKVLHDTDCAVWTTSHSEALASPDIESILCPVDASPNAARLIHAAEDIAAQYGAVVRLVHAIPASDAGATGDRDMSFERFLFDTEARQIAARQEEARTHFEVCVKAGNVPAVVREASVQYNADLVVMDRGRLQEFLGPFRSSAYEIIRESPCPVLSF